MPNLEMDAIEVHYAPMRLQRTLTPRCELLGQRLIQTADGAGTGSDSYQRLSDIPHFMRTGTRNEHLRQAFGNLWLIATVLLKGLRVKLPGAVSRDIEVFDRASARHQVTRVEAIAIAFALRRAFSPCRSEKVAQFFTHDFFHHRSRCVANLCPQILMKFSCLGWSREVRVGVASLPLDVVVCFFLWTGIVPSLWEFVWNVSRNGICLYYYLVYPSLGRLYFTHNSGWHRKDT